MTTKTIEELEALCKLDAPAEKFERLIREDIWKHYLYFLGNDRMYIKCLWLAYKRGLRKALDASQKEHIMSRDKSTQHQCKCKKT